MSSSLLPFYATSIAVVLVSVGLIYKYFLFKFDYWKNKNVPFLKPTIPFGNTGNPLTRKVNLGTEIKNFYDEAKSKGYKYFGFYMTVKPWFMPIDLDLVKNVMANDFSHFVDRGMYVNEKDDPVGAHLFALAGQKWRNLRVKLTPTFTSGKLKAMFQTLVDCGLVLEKYIKENVQNDEALDIKDILGRFSMDVIGSCAFGLDCNSFEDPDSPFRKYGKNIFRRTKFGAASLAFAISFPNLAKSIGIRLIPKDVAAFFSKIVEDTVNYRETNKEMRKDFLQLLIDSKNNKEENEEHKGDENALTMNEIVAQSFVFFAAGFETSSSTMTFALFELSTHPEIQERVRNEINEVLAKYDNKMTYDSLNELKYLGQVIDETLRKYPSLNLLIRQCTADYKVPSSDVIIEKGTMVAISALGIHFDKDYYENPNVFDPERFSVENKANLPQYAHIPFGEGPRKCIGMRFGLMQTKVGLTAILRNFSVKLNEKTELPLKMSSSDFVTSVVGGIWLNLEKIVK